MATTVEIKIRHKDNSTTTSDTTEYTTTIDISSGNPRFLAWELAHAIAPVIDKMVRRFGDPEDKPANR